MKKHKCPYQEHQEFCTHKDKEKSRSPFSGKIQRCRCGFNLPRECPLFIKYYQSLTKEEKATYKACKGLKTTYQVYPDINKQ